MSPQTTDYGLRSRHGFTVIEIIIVMAIFSIVLGVIIQVFVYTSGVQRRSRSQQQAVAEARTIMETVTREAQNGSFDYAYYADPDGNPETDDAVRLDQQASEPLQILALRDSQQQALRFRRQVVNGRGVVQLCRGSSCAPDDAANWAPISNESLDVTGLRLWAGPSASSFIRSQADPRLYLRNEQPWVTVVVEIQPRPVSGTPLPVYRLQTTVANRTYQR